MKPKNVITVAKSGAIYIPKLTTKYLGILGWSGVVIAVEENYIAMRFYKLSITPMMGEFVVKLQKKSGGRQAMTGGCLKFAEAINGDFGDANQLDLEFTLVVPPNEESVRIIIDRPSRIAEESTPESNEKHKQADICREMTKNKTCNNISCDGTSGDFAGTECPLFVNGSGILCGYQKAEEWLVRNGYSIEPEKSLDNTVSKSAEKQIGIFSKPEKPASVPRTRPLPDGLPEWLRGPLSRGEQVLVKSTYSTTTGKGWVVGAYETNDGLFVSLANCTASFVSKHAYCVGIEYIEKSPTVSLKPAAECFIVAGKLGIGLSALQIDAINSGGVPPEGHGLPDEMFE